MTELANKDIKQPLELRIIKNIEKIVNIKKREMEDGNKILFVF